MTRKTSHKKSTQGVRKRKPDDIKEALMLALADFLKNECELEIKDRILTCDEVEITNKSRLLHFIVGERDFDLQLIANRKQK